MESAGCGELANAFGPYDYRSAADRMNLPIVENNHFTPKVESLTGGITGSLGGDIDYTLRAFPNHLRALAAMGRLAIRDKTSRPTGAHYSVECYFERALRFRPSDGLVYMVYGDYIAKLGNVDKSLELMKKAVELAPNDATANYNLGLMYLRKKDYGQAKTYATKAYALGFPLPGLRNKLMEAGAWGSDEKN